MRSMDLAAEKIELARRILETKDAALIQQLRAVIEMQSEDWEAEMPDEIRASIEQGLLESRQGKTISHEEVMEKWQKRRRK